MLFMWKLTVRKKGNSFGFVKVCGQSRGSEASSDQIMKAHC
jgi:hypothetical protein